MGKHFYVVLCIMGLFALFSSTMSKSPVLPLYAASLGTPEYLLGFIAAASTIPGVLVSLPAGSFSDRVGRVRLLVLSGAIFASAPLLYLLIFDPLQLIVVRFYHGFATAIFGPVANAAIVDRFPQNKAEKISLFSSITYLGRFLAPLVGGYILLATVSDFSKLYLVVAGGGVLALLVSLGLRSRNDNNTMPSPEKADKSSITQKTESRRSKSILHDWREIASSGKVLTASLVEATQYYTFGAFEFFIVLYAKSLGIDPFISGVIVLFESFTVFVGKPLAGRLSDRIGRRKPIQFGLVVSGCSLIFIPFMTSFIYLVVVSVFYGVGFSLVTSSTSPYVAEQCRKEVTGSAMGFLSTIMDVGQVLGPIVTGLLIASLIGIVGAYAHLGLILFLSCVVFTVSSRVQPWKQTDQRSDSKQI
jgi:MFS family permease